MVYWSLFIVYIYKISFHVSNIFVLLKYLKPPFSLDYLTQSLKALTPHSFHKFRQLSSERENSPMGKESKLSPRCHCGPQSWPVHVGLSQHEDDLYGSSFGADTCLHQWPQEPESESEVTQSFRVFVTPWTVACQPLPSKISSRQEYWSALPFPSPGDLPDPGIEPRSSAL